MQADLNTNVKIQFQNEKTIKIDRFDGTKYTQWQDQMSCLLTALNLFYLMDPKSQPISEPDPNDFEKIKTKLVADKAKRETGEML